MPLSIRQWVDPHCGRHHDRNLNAAQNLRDIILFGTSMLACGEYIRPDLNLMQGLSL